MLHDRPDDARNGPPPGGPDRPGGSSAGAAAGDAAAPAAGSARGTGPGPEPGGAGPDPGGAPGPPADDDWDGRDDRTEGERTDAEHALDDARALTADLTDQLRRALADLDNLRKRYERELARERARQRANVAAAWLPVVDDLERALQHADADPGALVEGVRAVRDQALSVLERLGFPRFDDVGQPFDPTRHEAVSAVESDDAPAGSVLAAVRPGYGTAGQVLRPAGVVVARGQS